MGSKGTAVTAPGSVVRLRDGAQANAAILKLDNVSKIYTPSRRASVVALSSTNLAIRDGEFMSLVGPSGCGKTTLLNLMTGLLKPSEGQITFEGEPVTGPSPRISLVFQRPVLLPWRTILENVLLPIEVLKLGSREKYVARAHELLAMVGLSGFENALPKELSGGMQQRASIARALVYDSRVLMMDEPFAALDAMTREEMNLELLRIWKLTGRTVIFVTHNIPEAVLLSDRIVVMTSRPGKVKEIIDVDLPRPRTLSMMGTPDFGALADHIRELLHPQKPAAY
jgi:NitT/TauT family transport system ATP-binding protein